MSGDILNIYKSSPNEYFSTLIDDTSKKLNISLEIDIKLYLVSLLEKYLKPKNFSDHLDQPLAFQLKDALEAPPSQKITILKDLGDLTLYLSGMFPEFIEKKIVSLSYYISIGKIAYSQLSEVIYSVFKEAHFNKLYSSLANQFKPLVEVLSVIAQKNSFSSNECIYTQILKKHGIYEKTGFKSLQDALLETSILIQPNSLPS